MYLGRVVEAGCKDDLFNHPQHPYTQALLSATPVADPTLVKNRIQLEGELPSPLAPPSGCAFNPRCWVAQDLCKQDSPQLVKHATHPVACHFPLQN
jgi:dipeptide transport system ATP-binding protein